MFFFDFDHTSEDEEYYETLNVLMERWESEIVEFKEAKGQYSNEKIGQYFSAISNEANLRENQHGWLILGVSEKGEKHLVGTSYKQGNATLLEKLKYEIAQNTTDGITFLEIKELFPKVNGKSYRVLMLKIPAAAAGIPTAWNNRYYARSGESLVPLQQYKIDQIRSQERRDWSKQFVKGATIECLDPAAIQLARDRYKDKMHKEHISDEVDAMTDLQFLEKRKLIIHGNVTNAAMVLLGSSDYDYLLNSAPCLMWRLYAADGTNKDYEIFKIPFIKVTDQIFSKIRNLTYRYLPNQLSLFPHETQQYDLWLLRELLNNCIAHSNYQLGGRIYVNEFDDHIKITNPGDFLPESIENVLQISYNPPFYRNQLLAEAMVAFNMIDTATMGIRKVYKIQKERFFPMPDYDFSVSNQVAVTVYGKILDEKYTYILYNHPDMDLETAYLLDQVQKGNGQNLTPNAVKYLRQHNLVEGRVNHLFLSAEVAQSISEEAQYIKNKGFDDQYYRDMILDYITKFGKAKRSDIRGLLWDKLPDVLNEKQKDRKILTLLTSLKRSGKITTDSENKQKSHWILTDKLG